MNTILEVWQKLPFGKKQQLSTQFGFKIYGTTEEQLIWDLENKIPQGFLVVEKEVVVEPIVEKVVEDVVDVIVEPKSVKKLVKKAKKKK